MASTRQIWKAFAAAVGAELREDTTIRGISGLEHKVQAIAVDDKTRRIVIVAAEADPRMAALVQVDVQASMPEAKVLIARPIAIDISLMARKMLEPFNVGEIDFDKARQFLDQLKDKNQDTTNALIGPLTESGATNIQNIFENVQLPAVDQIVSVISQASILPWQDILEMFNESAKSGTLDLRAFLSRDTIAADLQAGICPIPLYNFSESDFDLFLDGRRVDECRERIKSLGIYQYFFPPPDQLALALVDEGIGQRDAILNDANMAPEMGHPFGDAEVVESAVEMKDLVDSLRDKKLIVEGEFGFEITPAGKSVRGLVKFSPREGLVTKLLNRITINFSLTDLIK